VTSTTGPSLLLSPFITTQIALVFLHLALRIFTQVCNCPDKLDHFLPGSWPLPSISTWTLFPSSYAVTVTSVSLGQHCRFQQERIHTHRNLARGTHFPPPHHSCAHHPHSVPRDFHQRFKTVCSSGCWFRQWFSLSHSFFGVRDTISLQRKNLLRTSSTLNAKKNNTQSFSEYRGLEYHMKGIHQCYVFF
jgi:hypothetical protein